MRLVIHINQERYPCITLEHNPDDLKVWPERTYEIQNKLYQKYANLSHQLQSVEQAILIDAGFIYRDGAWHRP